MSEESKEIVSANVWLTAEERELIVEFFSERFGISRDVFAGRRMYAGSRQRVYLVSEVLAKCSAEVVSGINLARQSAAIKPTTDFLQLHSSKITKNKLALTRDQAKAFVAGEELDVSELDLESYTTGYICLTYAEQALGCAHLKNGELHNLLSKDRRRKLEYL